MDDEDDRDHRKAMIEWLSDKDSDLRFVVTRHLNWDSTVPVLKWLVSQPDCDKAIAASVFWSADPASYLGNIAAGETPRGEGFEILDLVLRRWKAGLYPRSELAWRGDRTVEAYRQALAASASDPFKVPLDLYGPLKGRTPKGPAHLQPRENAELRQLLYRLGTDLGPSRKEQLRRDRAAILAAVRDVLGFWARGALWIGAAGIAVIAVVALTR